MTAPTAAGVVTVAECVREGVANAVAGALRTWLVAAVAALVIGGAVGADLATTRAIVDAQTEAIAAGANLLIADGRFPAHRCTALSSQRGIEGVAAVARSEDAPIDPVSGLPVPIIASSGGITDLVVDPADLGPLVAGTFVVDDDFAAARDIVPGRTLEVDSGGGRQRLRAAAVADLSRLGAEFESGIVVGLAGSAIATQCIVESAPGLADVVGATLAAATSTPDMPSEVRRAHSDLQRDYAAEYRKRPTRFMPLGAGAAVGVGLFGLAAVRRSDRGLYRSLGLSRSALALIAFVESVIVLTLGAGLALPVAILATDLAAGSTWARSSIVSASVAAAVALALHVTLRERSILALVKDR